MSITTGGVRLVIVTLMTGTAIAGFFMKLLPPEFMSGLIGSAITYYFSKNADGTPIETLSSVKPPIVINEIPPQSEPQPPPLVRKTLREILDERILANEPPETRRVSPFLNEHSA